MKKSEIVLLIFTVLIDQLTKFVVESRMALYESIEIISENSSLSVDVGESQILNYDS